MTDKHYCARPNLSWVTVEVFSVHSVLVKSAYNHTNYHHIQMFMQQYSRQKISI